MIRFLIALCLVVGLANVSDAQLLRRWRVESCPNGNCAQPQTKSTSAACAYGNCATGACLTNGCVAGNCPSGFCKAPVAKAVVKTAAKPVLATLEAVKAVVPKVASWGVAPVKAVTWRVHHRQVQKHNWGW